MRSVRFTLLLTIVVLLFAYAQDLAIVHANGVPLPCESNQPNDPQGICTPKFYGFTRARLSRTVPFVWLRRLAMSNAEIVYTVYPAGTAELRFEGGYTWSNGQWWWSVSPIPNPKHISGWVEQSALIYAPAGASGLAKWQIPARASLRRGVAEAVVLGYPSLVARTDNVVTILPKGAVFTLGTGNEPEWNPYTHKWWWWIEYTTPITTYMGWVEQRFITLVTP